MKECSGCKEVKPLGEFYLKHPRQSMRRQHLCKSCAKANATLWRAANPERVKANRLRNSHQLTEADWLAIWVRQSGLCLICERPGDPTRWFHVDHDHRCCGSTKSCNQCLRGLLCHKCNMGLGRFGDSAYGLQAAINYLETH